MSLIAWFREVGRDDVGLVGGKNAALGEMFTELRAAGVSVPDGFAVTAEAYRAVLRHNELEGPLSDLLGGLDRDDTSDLQRRARQARAMLMGAAWPPGLQEAIGAAYTRLCEDAGQPDLAVAVRSSATAEDLPEASFAGQQESFLYVVGETDLLATVRRCIASLFTARAIAYREDMGFAHLDVALSVGVQRMVRSDTGSAGVLFTLDPDSGHPDVIYLSSTWGLGEAVVQGRVDPDAFYVHRPTLERGFAPVVGRTIGQKQQELTWLPDDHRLSWEDVSEARQRLPSLSDDEVLQLARWAVLIEKHFEQARGCASPMDIEWARDGVTGELFIVQARPETVHRGRELPGLKRYTLAPHDEQPLATGLAVGEAIACGPVRVVLTPQDMDKVHTGDILVCPHTDPDWEPIMKRVAGVVTERGGRTSHAAIVARELGVPAVVGATDATKILQTGVEVTLSCAGSAVGRVYGRPLPFEVEEVAYEAVEPTRTKVMVNLADPGQALAVSQLPVEGVGLARMEFVLAGHVGVHPLALTRYDALTPELQRSVDALVGPEERTEYFVRRLAEGVGMLAAAFWPRPVILRCSDFKTNEYANLLGGSIFEPEEENPMLGWRGASRYSHPDYADGFALELQAIRRVREVFGLENLHVMIPFCRTPEEGEAVLEVLARAGLRRGEGGLKVWVMAEIPSNVLAAAEFSALFDGFSIGSNDLTQLVLGVDRDSERVAPLFDENQPAVKRAIAMLIETAHAHGKPVGICGQAPSDFPEFAAFLVERGIDSISLTPDSVLRTLPRIAQAEAG